jgi:hypothetical protein
VGCRTPATSVLLLKDAEDDNSDRLVWKWSHGAATDLFAFGNPVTGSTDYGLCIYGSDAGVPALALAAEVNGSSMCAGTFCWRPIGVEGFKYRDRDGTAGHLSLVKLRTGGDGEARILVKAKGMNLPMPTPADGNNLLRQDPVVTVQLVNTEGECWQAVFHSPAQRVSGSLLKDRF